MSVPVRAAARHGSGSATRAVAGRAGRGVTEQAWQAELGAARERIAARRPPGCPTPHKPGYDPACRAERHVAARAGGPGRRLYRCRCGYRHWTTKPAATRTSSTAQDHSGGRTR